MVHTHTHLASFLYFVLLVSGCSVMLLVFRTVTVVVETNGRYKLEKSAFFTSDMRDIKFVREKSAMTQNLGHVGVISNSGSFYALLP